MISVLDTLNSYILNLESFLAHPLEPGYLGLNMGSTTYSYSGLKQNISSFPSQCDSVVVNL